MGVTIDKLNERMDLMDKELMTMDEKMRNIEKELEITRRTAAGRQMEVVVLDERVEELEGRGWRAGSKSLLRRRAL